MFNIWILLNGVIQLTCDFPPLLGNPTSLHIYFRIVPCTFATQKPSPKPSQPANFGGLGHWKHWVLMGNLKDSSYKYDPREISHRTPKKLGWCSSSTHLVFGAVNIEIVPTFSHHSRRKLLKHRTWEDRCRYCSPKPWLNTWIDLGLLFFRWFFV